MHQCNAAAQKGGGGLTDSALCSLPQVNISSREAAVAPALIDSLSEYAGTYTTKVLKGTNGQQAPQIELAIASSKNGVCTAPLLCLPLGFGVE